MKSFNIPDEEALQYDIKWAYNAKEVNEWLANHPVEWGWFKEEAKRCALTDRRTNMKHLAIAIGHNHPDEVVQGYVDVNDHLLPVLARHLLLAVPELGGLIQIKAIKYSFSDVFNGPEHN